MTRHTSSTDRRELLADSAYRYAARAVVEEHRASLEVARGDIVLVHNPLRHGAAIDGWHQVIEVIDPDNIQAFNLDPDKPDHLVRVGVDDLIRVYRQLWPDPSAEPRGRAAEPVEAA